MLVLLSNPLTSQSTSINLTNCMSDAQLTNIYQGLKQGEYLKTRVEKAEATLLSAEKVMKEQEYLLNNKDQVIGLKNTLYESLKFQNEMDMKIKSAEIDRLNETLKVKDKIHKSDKKKSLWTGIKIGGVSIAVLGTVAILLLK